MKGSELAINIHPSDRYFQRLYSSFGAYSRFRTSLSSSWLQLGAINLVYSRAKEPVVHIQINTLVYVCGEDGTSLRLGHR